mgnify:CR=1 FL=1
MRSFRKAMQQKDELILLVARNTAIKNQFPRMYLNSFHLSGPVVQLPRQRAPAGSPLVLNVGNIMLRRVQAGLGAWLAVVVQVYFRCPVCKHTMAILHAPQFI